MLVKQTGILLLLVGLLFLSPNLFGLEVESSSEPHTHHIFFVHGLGGTIDSFGAMPEILPQHLGSSFPDVTFVSHKFEYPTDDDNMFADNFAQMLAEFIKEAAGELSSEDKISIVSHSQGGLVSTIWYFFSSLGRKEMYPEYSDNVDVIVTLGTPFWGSKVATILTQHESTGRVTQLLAQRMSGELGEKQLRSMSFGSQMISSFRNNVLNTPHLVLHELGARIRPLNISAVFDGYRRTKLPKIGRKQLKNPIRNLDNFVFGRKFFESDGVVSVPASRFDSYYTVEEPLNEHAALGFQQYKTGFSDHLVVMGVHASPTPDTYYDISEVPEKCIDLNICDHPTYPWIVKHFAGEPIPRFADDTHPMAYSGFTLEMHAIFPEGVDARFVDEVEIEIASRSKYENFEIVLNPFFEILSRYDYVNEKNEDRLNELNVNLTGHIRIDDEDINDPLYGAILERGHSVIVRVKAPGYPERLIPVKIQPTYSSYAQFYIRP